MNFFGVQAKKWLTKKECSCDKGTHGDVDIIYSERTRLIIRNLKVKFKL